VDGVEYAVKCTRRRFKGQADRDRYLQEVKALAKVCAADSSEEVLHVVRYHQAWIEDERLFMQTELCEESLEMALREGRPGGRMGLEEVFDFGRQMLLALDVLHRHGLVHLDVKVRKEPTTFTSTLPPSLPPSLPCSLPTSSSKPACTS
jgi:serine/threonine protein kinase